MNQEKNEPIYIFGHRKPDTDSVTAAISLSYLKNQLGYDTIPVILSGTNNETKYALDYFQVEEPEFLNDVKLKIRDLNYTKNYYVQDEECIYQGYEYMNKVGISKIPIVNNDNVIVGVMAMKDIAKNLIAGNIHALHTSYDNILYTLHGTAILRFDEEIEGEIVVPTYRSTTFIQSIPLSRQNILIVGDRHSIIEYAITNDVQLIILSGDSIIKESHLQLAKEKKINIIQTSLSALEVARIINLCNYIKSLLPNTKALSLDENELVSNFVNIANETKFSYFPVIDKEKKCLGILRLSDTASCKRKKVILVDHNTKGQSIEGIEDAEVLEIIDHHNIGDVITKEPINFRNMPVGSSNTIIYQLYKENHIDIPTHIAGLMASGIISDTLLLKSPTTTLYDKEALTDLCKIANIKYEEYGLNMIRAGASLKGKSKEEILYTDFKVYPVEEKQMGIGQIFTTNPDEILEEKEEYIKLLNNVAKNNDFYIVFLAVTDVLTNGSYIFYNQDVKEIIKRAFHIEAEEGEYLADVVSRKLQIVPQILEAAK